MSALQLLALSGELIYTFDFSAEIPATSPATSVSSVTVTVPAELTKVGQTDDLANKRTNVLLKAAAGGKHGMSLQVEAKATLSNTEKIVQYMTVRLSGS